MQAALRLARQRPQSFARSLATTANPGHVASAATTSSAPSKSAAPIPLSNVEAQWAKMTNDDKVSVQEQLEELQKKDWKVLSLDEKKAGASRVSLRNRRGL